ncbi:MAG: hypothetical protein AAFY72_18145, partial [Cyanobacteria bacterium J06649_4]
HQTEPDDAIQLLTRLTNCSPTQIKTLMSQLPGTIQLNLYDYQASRLIQIMKERLTIRLSPLDTP